MDREIECLVYDLFDDHGEHDDGSEIPALPPIPPAWLDDEPDEDLPF